MDVDHVCEWSNKVHRWRFVVMASCILRLAFVRTKETILAVLHRSLLRSSTLKECQRGNGIGLYGLTNLWNQLNRLFCNGTKQTVSTL